ncbi:hypothetical protein A5658_04775 [Mycobacterium sp. 1245111.1]|nr:hypothetical protein A5658_04775 [Mycobacterium sp. 1245111.1]
MPLLGAAMRATAIQPRAIKSLTTPPAVRAVDTFHVAIVSRGETQKHDRHESSAPNWLHNLLSLTPRNLQPTDRDVEHECAHQNTNPFASLMAYG